LPITALSIGPGCVIVGAGYSSGFQAFSGQECMLTFPEGSRRLRVEGLSVYAPRNGTLTQAIEIDLRGVDVVTGRYALYHFEGDGDPPGPVPDDPCPPNPGAQHGPGLVAQP
jgi:hypothetical protein